MNWLTALFTALGQFFGVVNKAIPPDEIRTDNHNIQKPKKESRVRNQLEQQAFNYLKRNPETDVATYVNYRYDSLEEEDRKELTELLTARLNAFWQKHPKRKGPTH